MIGSLWLRKPFLVGILLPNQWRYDRDQHGDIMGVLRDNLTFLCNQQYDISVCLCVCVWKWWSHLMILLYRYIMVIFEIFKYYLYFLRENDHKPSILFVFFLDTSPPFRLAMLGVCPIEHFFWGFEARSSKHFFFFRQFFFSTNFVFFFFFVRVFHNTFYPSWDEVLWVFLKLRRSSTLRFGYSAAKNVLQEYQYLI